MDAMMRTPFYRLGMKGPRPTEVLFVPQDLRTTDPTFVIELEHGQMGLAGTIGDVSGASAFDIPPPNPLWEQHLHSFSWLRHMRASKEEGGDIIAKRLVGEWIARHRSPRGTAFQPMVTSRRILSWLCSAGVLLDDADPRAYGDFLRSLDMQLTHLAMACGQTPAGLARLNCRMVLVYAGLCLADQDRLIELHEPAFVDQLDQFIRPSGSPMTRSSQGIADLLLDLLPMQQCYVARDKVPPPALRAAIDRLFPWLRYMRMGDGQLARFHGAGVPEYAKLATVLAYDETLHDLTPSPDMGYMRVEAGHTVVLVDTAGPPALEVSDRAHASSLAFEMSSGNHLIIINCGSPTAQHEAMRRLARSTAAHSTLAIEGASSGHLVPAAQMPGLGGVDGLTGPSAVQASMTTHAGGTTEIEAAHNGYFDRFRVMHWRALRLSADGRTLEGRDRLAHPDASSRITGDLPFGIHFHLHPDVEARLGETPGTAHLTLPNGEQWCLQMRGDATLGFEDSMFLNDTSGPKRNLQIVLRGRCLDRADVQWRLERMPASSGSLT